jgi:pseudaminic acid cytidylyltransferase
MKRLAIIPARGGSKRIPGKNIITFFDKPIISYPLQVCLNSNLFDEVMVSTDDDQIAKISIEYGAKVPSRRTEQNSSDTASTADVISEVLEFYAGQGLVFESVCCIYPTSIFVDQEMLVEASKRLESHSCDSVVSITKFTYPVQRALYKRNNLVGFINPENALKRSQDFEVFFHDAAQFYFFKTGSFLDSKALFSSQTQGIEIDPYLVQDIDTMDDLKIAEMKFRLKNNL